MSGDREKALEAGCDDYDTKPVELPRLLAKIEALLEKKQPWDPLPPPPGRYPWAAVSSSNPSSALFA